MTTMGRWGDENDSIDEQAAAVIGALTLVEALGRIGVELKAIREMLAEVFRDRGG